MARSGTRRPGPTSRSWLRVVVGRCAHGEAAPIAGRALAPLRSPRSVNLVGASPPRPASLELRLKLRSAGPPLGNPEVVDNP